MKNSTHAVDSTLKSDSTKDRKPKNLLIYPKFQLNLLATNTVILLMSFAFVGIQSYRSFSQLKTVGMAAGLAPAHPYYRFVDLQSHTVYQNLIIAFLISFVFSSIFSLYLSHRLAGPICRMKSYFAEIAESGRVTHDVKFRKHDFFEELPNLINRALKKIK